MNIDKTERRTMEDYLNVLKNCPESRLEAECGIYDNFPILIQGNFGDIAEHLFASPNYALKELRPAGLFEKENKATVTRNEDTFVFYYVPGTVQLNAKEGNIGNYLVGNPEKKSLEQEFNILWTIHPYQGTAPKLEANLNITPEEIKKKYGIKMDGASDARAMALAVFDIGEIIIKNKLYACMPYAMGFDYFGQHGRVPFNFPK